MIPALLFLLVTAGAAEPVPLRAERRPTVAVLPGPEGTRAAAVRRVANGDIVLVLLEPDGTVRRLIGPDGWRPGGAIAAGGDVSRVAVDDDGAVWLLGPKGLRAWSGDALRDVPCDGCRDLRPASEVPVGAPTATVPLAPGLVAVTDTPDPAASALVAVEHGWALVTGDRRGPARPAPEGQVGGLRLGHDGGVWTLRGDRVENAGTERVLPGFPAGEGVTARLLDDPEGGVTALAWDDRHLRVWTLGLDGPSALRFDQHWLPGGATVVWPRAAASGDTGPVASVLDVPLPPGLVLTGAAVGPAHVVIVGTTPGDRRPEPVVLTVSRIPRG